MYTVQAYSMIASVPNRLLKLWGQLLASFIDLMINSSLLFGGCPAHCTGAFVTPRPRRQWSPQEELPIYWPELSLLTLPKLFYRVVNVQLVQRLTSAEFLPRHHSKETAMLKVFTDSNEEQTVATMRFWVYSIFEPRLTLSIKACHTHCRRC